MENLNLNGLLERNSIYHQFCEYLHEIENEITHLTSKRGIYIYGNVGVGKTKFVRSILKELNYDIIEFDICDVKSKFMDCITLYKEKSNNLVSFFNAKKKHTAIIIDDIDHINSSEKGALSSLIKIIRPKKTKKQKKEEYITVPIICIGSNTLDKKIKELMKVAYCIEIPIPTKNQIYNIIQKYDPTLTNSVKNLCVEYIQCDLHKLTIVTDLLEMDKDYIINNINSNIFFSKNNNNDTKMITEKLLNNTYTLNQHSTFMNETDRTIVSLLWHENVILSFDKNDNDMLDILTLYIKLLENICFGDYIDRITFQNQLWQFNEMTSIIKVFKNNLILQSDNIHKEPIYSSRFTKVLTKYSTEYNNSVFTQNICYKLALDKSDIFAFFAELKNKYDNDEIHAFMSKYDIQKLDIARMYRFLDRFSNNKIKKNNISNANDWDDDLEYFDNEDIQEQEYC